MQNAWLRNPSKRAGRRERIDLFEDCSRTSLPMIKDSKNDGKSGEGSRMEMWTREGSGGYISLQEKWRKL